MLKLFRVNMRELKKKDDYQVGRRVSLFPESDLAPSSEPSESFEARGVYNLTDSLSPWRQVLFVDPDAAPLSAEEKARKKRVTSIVIGGE